MITPIPTRRAWITAPRLALDILLLALAAGWVLVLASAGAATACLAVIR